MSHSFSPFMQNSHCNLLPNKFFLAQNERKPSVGRASLRPFMDSQNIYSCTRTGNRGKPEVKGGREEGRDKEQGFVPFSVLMPIHLPHTKS